MSVEGDILIALTTVAPAWPIGPETNDLPRITYQQVGGQSVSFLDRIRPTLKNGRFQISTWAATSVQASQIALAAEDALIAATAFQATPLGAPVADFEQDTGLHGRRQDFSIWSPR
jgi:hypothetical protein